MFLLYPDLGCTMSEDVVIVGGARTPFCEWVGGKRGDGKAGGAPETMDCIPEPQIRERVNIGTSCGIPALRPA